MAKIGENLPDPNDLESIVEFIGAIQREVDGLIEFGTPQDPTDDTSTTLAGSASGAHPGSLQNIHGSWAEAEFGAVNTAVTFYHHLGLDVIGTDLPNVRWLFTNFRHSGAGPATGCLSLEYDDALCTVAANSIDLVIRASPGGVRTIAAGANAVKCTVFFIPAVR
jgi:hypothetical protein